MTIKYQITLEYSPEDEQWAASFMGEPFFSALHASPDQAVKNLLDIDAQWWSDANEMENE